MPGPELASSARLYQPVPSRHSHCDVHIHTCALQGVRRPLGCTVTCTHTHRSTHIHAHAHTRRSMYVRAHTPRSMHACTHTGACMHTYKSTHKRSHTLTNTSIPRDTLFAQIPSLTPKDTLSPTHARSLTLRCHAETPLSGAVSGVPRSGFSRSLEWMCHPFPLCPWTVS